MLSHHTFRSWEAEGENKRIQVIHEQRKDHCNPEWFFFPPVIFSCLPVDAHHVELQRSTCECPLSSKDQTQVPPVGQNPHRWHRQGCLPLAFIQLETHKGRTVLLLSTSEDLKLEIKRLSLKGRGKRFLPFGLEAEEKSIVDSNLRSTSCKDGEYF